MEDASAVKRSLYRYLMDVARKVGGDTPDGKSVGAFERLM